MKRVYIAPKLELIHLVRQVALLEASKSNNDGEQSGEIGGGLGLNLESTIDKLQG
jgi:hypothetical protein